MNGIAEGGGRRECEMTTKDGGRRGEEGSIPHTCGG